jgi:hypothetical protein
MRLPNFFLYLSLGDGSSEVVTKSTKEFWDNNAKLATPTSVTAHWLLLVQLVEMKLLILHH